ncbi:MAG TPA: hypothetical protein VHT21_22890, partial [Stellaceae bacterium]|nr:hypothetical protein [Stellaceae bacterium]
ASVGAFAGVENRPLWSDAASALRRPTPQPACGLAGIWHNQVNSVEYNRFFNRSLMRDYLTRGNVIVLGDVTVPVDIHCLKVCAASMTRRKGIGTTRYVAYSAAEPDPSRLG